MNEAPPQEYVAAVRNYGHAFAHAVRRGKDARDIAAEAVLALHAQWPQLTRDRRTPDVGLACRAVRLRLIDYCRKEYGSTRTSERRRANVKPHAFARPLAPDWQGAASDDTEAEALARVAPTLDEIVEILLDRCWAWETVEIRARRRRALQLLARSARFGTDGLSYRDVADEIGWSESRINQILQHLRSRVRSDQNLIDAIT